MDNFTWGHVYAIILLIGVMVYLPWGILDFREWRRSRRKHD